MNYSESHYPIMEKTWKGGELSQEWAVHQNYSRSASIILPGGHKRSQNNIKELQDSRVTVKVKVRVSTIKKDTEQKWLPTESPNEKNKDPSHICQ